MKRLILILAVSLISVSNIHSQERTKRQTESQDVLKKINKSYAFSLSGKITNLKNGEPLSGASVYIQDSKI